MILVLTAALLIAQAAPGPGAPAVVAPAKPSAAPVAPTAAAAQTDDPPLDLEQLQQMYRDTCAAREYGAYDDMCDQLRLQVRNAERQAAREARRHPRPAPAATAAPP